jgi:3-methyladenine DNA glycosylase AlkD
MEELISFVGRELGARADAEKAAAMAAYLKTDMPFYGVQKQGRTEVMRAIRRRFPVNDLVTYRTAVTSLWEQPHREEKYLAIGLARAHPDYLLVENLDLYRRLIVEGGWWDLVDDVAINCVGLVYLRHRPETEPCIDAWIEDEDMWLRRTSLISPIKHKHDTDYERLFDHCLRRAHEREFFIRKAIGWTLREYAKTAPERVRDFLLENRDRWSGLTRREAGKHLDIIWG